MKKMTPHGITELERVNKSLEVNIHRSEYSDLWVHSMGPTTENTIGANLEH
jgi:hypothetical protein